MDESSTGEPQQLHRYQNGVWSAIPFDQLFIQVRGPDGPIELSLSILAALITPNIEQKVDESLAAAIRVAGASNNGSAVAGGRP